MSPNDTVLTIFNNPSSRFQDTCTQRKELSMQRLEHVVVWLSHFAKPVSDIVRLIVITNTLRLAVPLIFQVRLPHFFECVL